MRNKPENSFVRYWANVWAGIATTFVGMRLTWGYLFSKPFTMQYPEVKPVVPDTHRGLHALNEEGCLVCMSCAKVCPVDAITIESVGRGRDAMLTVFDVDYSRCLFCQLCDESCSSSALQMGARWDLAGTTREGTRLHLIRTKTAEEIAAHEAELARKEAEKLAKIEATRKAKETADAKAKADADAAAAAQPGDAPAAGGDK